MTPLKGYLHKVPWNIHSFQISTWRAIPVVREVEALAPMLLAGDECLLCAFFFGLTGPVLVLTGGRNRTEEISLDLHVAELPVL